MRKWYEKSLQGTTKTVMWNVDVKTSFQKHTLSALKIVLFSKMMYRSHGKSIVFLFNTMIHGRRFVVCIRNEPTASFRLWQSDTSLIAEFSFFDSDPHSHLEKSMKGGWDLCVRMRRMDRHWSVTIWLWHIMLFKDFTECSNGVFRQTVLCSWSVLSEWASFTSTLYKQSHVGA